MNNKKTKIWVQEYVGYSGRYNIWISVPGQLSQMLSWHCSREDTDRLLKKYIQEYNVDMDDVNSIY